MDSNRPAARGAPLQNRLPPFSVEIPPRGAPPPPPLPELLAPGTAVYLTFLPHTPWAETVAVARAVREAGMRPVPHLAARAVPDHRALAGTPGRAGPGGARGPLGGARGPPPPPGGVPQG